MLFDLLKLLTLFGNNNNELYYIHFFKKKNSKNKDVDEQKLQKELTKILRYFSKARYLLEIIQPFGNYKMTYQHEIAPNNISFFSENTTTHILDENQKSISSNCLLPFCSGQHMFCFLLRIDPESKNTATTATPRRRLRFHS